MAPDRLPLDPTSRKPQFLRPRPGHSPFRCMCPPAEYHQRGDYLKACLALLAAESPGSVQVLTRRLAGMGLAGIGRSSVRHALSAMEANGLVETACQSAPPKPAEPTHRLTADGTRWLRGWGLGEQHSQGGCDGPSLAKLDLMAP